MHAISIEKVLFCATTLKDALHAISALPQFHHQKSPPFKPKGKSDPPQAISQVRPTNQYQTNHPGTWPG